MLIELSGTCGFKGFKAMRQTPDASAGYIYFDMYRCGAPFGLAVLFKENSYDGPYAIN